MQKLHILFVISTIALRCIDGFPPKNSEPNKRYVSRKKIEKRRKTCPRCLTLASILFFPPSSQAAPFLLPVEDRLPSHACLGLLLIASDRSLCRCQKGRLKRSSWLAPRPRTAKAPRPSWMSQCGNSAAEYHSGRPVQNQDQQPAVAKRAAGPAAERVRRLGHRRHGRPGRPVQDPHV